VVIGCGVCRVGVFTEGTLGTDSRLPGRTKGTMLAGSLSCVACFLEELEIRIGLVQYKLVRFRMVVSLEDLEQ